MSASVADEYRSLVAEIAGPLSLGDSIKAVLHRVARKTGLTDRRVRAIWNREVTDLRGQELMALLRAAREAKNLEAAIHERQQLLSRLAACEAALGLRTQDDDRPMDHASR